MIPLAGRVLAGLDEFMLRIGHLKILASVANEVGGSWGRIERTFSQFLTEFVAVPDDELPHITEYLAQKRLCPSTTESDGEDERDKYRYPELRLEEDAAGKHLYASDREISVWRQDLWMAAPGVRSRVGAVTVQAKSGSKTGVSHVRDWGVLLELFSSSGQLAAEGHLVVKLGRESTGLTWRQNPYLIGYERLVFAYLLFMADFDVMARLCPRLCQTREPLKKSDATAVFNEALSEVSQEASKTRVLSSTRQFQLFQVLREIQGQQRSGAVKASTTWHRAASRLEMYVDIGLLEKGRQGEFEKYEYKFYRTCSPRPVVT